MALNRVLPKLLYGNVNFCCLCFNETDHDTININDEVFAEAGSSVAMSVIITTVFGEDILDTVTSFGVFCNLCTVNAIHSYDFIKSCKDNISSLNSALKSVNESLENTLPDTDSYKTLCVAIDLDDYTSKQFYDDNVNSCASVFQRINNLTIFKDEPNMMKVNSTRNIFKEEPKTIRNSTKVGKMVENKYRRTLTFDIPNFPTRDICVNQDPELKCKECFKRFFIESKLRKHYFRKHYPRNIKCLKCPRKFISEEMLKEHIVLVHDGVCKVCGKHFSNKSVLKKHEQNHDFQITCSDCGRLYHSMEALRKHITDDVCRQKMKKTAEQAIYECDHCHKRYCYKFYLAKHIMHEHGKKEGFRCEYCNKNFYTQSRLQTHLVKHTREKKFMCSICEKYFVTRESLIYHTRLHTGETPYKCDYCDRAFLNASRRLDHMRRHHLPPGFECDVCHTKFKATASLLKHRKRHLKQLPDSQKQ